MIRIHLAILLLAIGSLSSPGQEPSWTKEAKDRTKRTALHDASQHVRGDTGKWNDDAILQRVPPIARKPAKVSLDDWADQLLEKTVQLKSTEDNWLVFRTKQLDDHDRVWIQRIQRRGKEFTIVVNQAIWQGRYRKNFTYYQLLAINLGKLKPGTYEVKWLLEPMAFTKFDGDSRPRTNWPKDEHPTGKKPIEKRLTFRVGNGVE